MSYSCRFHLRAFGNHANDRASCGMRFKPMCIILRPCSSQGDVGATTAWFPNQTSTMFLNVMNVNYAQTRKSSITGNGDAFGDLLDKHIQSVVGALFNTLKTEAQAAAGSEARARHANPKVTSAVMHTATPQDFFHRCAGDYEQISNLDQVALKGLEGRHDFGILLNPDEMYDMLSSFGLLTGEGQNARAVKASVNPHQSAYNKLAQFGRASRATKTAGSYGSVNAPTVSIGISGNIHPSMYVPMERGEFGSHHVCMKERLLIGTGRPVQPHDDLPADYVMPADCDRWKWVPLVPGVAKILGLNESCSNPDVAAKTLQRVNAGACV